MASPIKTIVDKLRMRNMVKLPQVVIEESNIGIGKDVQVIYGRNYSAVVILPVGIKLQERQAERISIIVNESLI